MGCGLLITGSQEAAPRHYRINRTGFVYTQFRCVACHESYLDKKPGISVSDRAPAASAPPKSFESMTAGLVPKQEGFPFSTGKDGTIIEQDGHLIVVPKSIDPNKALRQLQRMNTVTKSGLGVMARARILQRKGAL